MTKKVSLSEFQTFIGYLYEHAPKNIKRIEWDEHKYYKFVYLGSRYIALKDIETG